MPAKVSKTASKATTTKAKLRTAGDVISRLRWSEEEDCTTILMGYDDRINGPMEKYIADYKSIDDGGDIPQHRIQYFRRAEASNGAGMNRAILWDREGRVDRVFGSGLGSDTPASKHTVQLAYAAISNMKRIAEEKETMRQEKEKRRARRMKQVGLHKGNASSTNVRSDKTTQSTRSLYRCQWTSATSYVFDRATTQWTPQAKSEKRISNTSTNNKTARQLQLVTWNVLFDLYADSILFEGDIPEKRWKLLIELLGDTNADLIALQEVTPQFVSQICGSSWVQNQYSVSATPGHCEAVEPHGNMLLWNRNALVEAALPHTGLNLLEDGERKRSIIATLQCISNPDMVLVCAAVHLPCNVKGEDETRADRAIARRREINTIVAKLQVLEQEQGNMQPGNTVVPIILGDFNTDEKDQELENGGFINFLSLAGNSTEGIFLDAWNETKHDQLGLTFNPETNERASTFKKGPRRIDRILVGRDTLLRAVRGEMIGATLEGGALPPSDHYGLSVTFDTEIQWKASTSTTSGGLQHRSAWASTALPTTDTLLALTLEDSHLGSTILFDPNSSLPVPHITLLNGFAELLSVESRHLAVQAVSNAVAQTLIATASFDIPFGNDCLSVFEHRDSATLVCEPNSSCDWLHTLYSNLRASFRFCDGQEARFADGWNPHVTLQKFATVDAARQRANQAELQESQFIRAQAVVIYQRDAVDRNFYAHATVPLQKRQQHILSSSPKSFLADAGASLSSYFEKGAAPFLSTVERVCQATTASMSEGKLSATLRRYGSCRFHSSIPGISDVDVVVELAASRGNEQTTSNISISAFLQRVSARLQSIHKSAKTRVRVAGSNGVALQFLTVKLCAQAPSIDLIVCHLNTEREATGSSGMAAMESLDDGRLILDTLRSFGAVETFEQVLRLVKIWAYKRQVYGAPLGYLGGGGWAVLLARAIIKGVSSGDLCLTKRNGSGVTADNVVMAGVLKYFFAETVRSWSNSLFVIDDNSSLGDSALQIKEKAIARGTLAIFAPVSENDFARNMTRSTAEVMHHELIRAHALAKANPSSGLVDIFLPIQDVEVCNNEGSILLLEIQVDRLGTRSLPEVKAWASCQMLATLVAVENELSPETVRPFSRHFRSKGNLLFIVRLLDKSADAMGSFLRKRREFLYRDARSFFQESEETTTELPLRMQCLKPELFREAYC